MNLVQNKEYIIRTVDTDDLVFKHQGISSQNANYAPMYFQLFSGQVNAMSPDLISYLDTVSDEQLLPTFG